MINSPLHQNVLDSVLNIHQLYQIILMILLTQVQYRAKYVRKVMFWLVQLKQI
jgi:hypothetical protein